eukprot:CAMPEP_0118633512 /NCGR_PEP_ID=MMETSP0785-20121206/1037_1 /TAXON_ID=91992 /ORGANISM="Bolidomonas pacifica, Strain CCMP 1866" /LENGTH=1378 /DNA_ID=CAMNT_0006524393 /DNA_START=171 /DNA_END=4304 /DNA_ORIENTATION=+
MRAHVAKAVTKSTRNVLKRQPSSPHHGGLGDGPSAMDELAEAANFWKAVKTKVEDANDVMLRSGEEFGSNASMKSAVRSDVESRGGIGRRPSLQLAETLKGFGDKINKWTLPPFLQKYADSVPVIHPDNHLKVKWDILLGGLIFFSVIVIPLRIGFDLTMTPDGELSDILIDCMFGLDIVVSFDTAYIGGQDENGEDELVTSRYLIAKEYVHPMRGWFLIDFFSTVPIDKVVAKFSDPKAGGQTRMVKILRLARLMKLTRVMKLGKFMKNIDMDSINPAAFGLVSLLGKIVFTGHLLSCFWYFMTGDTVDLDDHETEWATEFGIKNSTLGEKYATSFYWTIATMMAVGYGDVYAMNSKERLYSIFAQLVGAVSFGAMIATVNILVASSDPRARAYKSKMSELKSYLKERNVPKALADNVKVAFKYYMAKKSVFTENDLVMDLPSSIRTELVKQAYEVDIEKIKYLKNEDDAYVTYIMLSLKPFNCSPFDVILEQNDIADEVVFLLRGTVQLLHRGKDVDDAAKVLVDDPEEIPEDNSTPCLVGIVTEGGFFGDLGLTQKTPRVATYEAQNICQMLSISRNDLEDANHMYALSGKNFNEEINIRYAAFSKAMASEMIISEENGGMCKSELFMDGTVVSAHSIKFTNSGLNLSMRSERRRADRNSPKNAYSSPDVASGGGVPTMPSGIKRMNSSELLSSRGGGRRASTPSINIDDLDTSNHSKESPNYKRKKSFKTRRNSIISPVDGEKLVEEKDETPMDLLRRGIIDPNMPIKVKWDMFVGVLIVFSVIVVPFRLGFDVPATPTSTAQDIVIDTIFWLDLVTTFRCAFEDVENDILVTVPKEIYANYFKTWFFIDFFSVFPIAEIVEYFMKKSSVSVVGVGNETAIDGAGGGDSGLESLALLKVVRLIRLLKLVRLLKLGSYLEKIEEEFNINPAAFELIKLLITVTFIAHMFGCFWFFTSVQTTDPADAWYADVDDTLDIQDKYIASLYWAFTTMTTVGYGDITANSVSEKWYAVVIMMLGATVFGYILANIATLMGQLNARDSRVNESITAVAEYLSEKNISVGLQKNIKTHIRFSLSCKSVFDEYSIMKKLPTTLARKLFYHNHRDTLKTICLFDHLKSTGVIMYVFNMLSPAQFADGHEIFKENSIPNDVFFVTNGRAEVVKSVRSADAPDGIEIIHCADVLPGQIVGYLGMLNNTVHRHSCFARGYVSVYYLHVHDLATIVYDHPFVSERLQEALGKCIHKQNEEFKKKTLEERNKKFAEIMFSESNLLGLEGGGRPIIKISDDELASIASGKLSPETILTPKLTRFSVQAPKSGKGGMIRPGGLRIHPTQEGGEKEEEEDEGGSNECVSPVMQEVQPDSDVSLVVSEPSSPMK